MPLGLARQGPRLYLVCRFGDYENERSLALHRIVSAKASTCTFERQKDFGLQKYDDDGRFGYLVKKSAFSSPYFDRRVDRVSLAAVAAFELMQSLLNGSGQCLEQRESVSLFG